MRVWRHLGTWGSVQRPYHLQCPEVCYRYRCLRRWALCTRNVNFPAFCRCESILGRKSTNVICSFHFLSFRIHFLSCSFHFASISFTGRYAQTGHVSILPSALIFVIFCYRLLSFWRPVQVAIFRVHEHVHV